MRSIIAGIASALFAFTGCGHKQAAEQVQSNEVPYPPPDPKLMEFLRNIYLSHGAKAELDGDWVVVEGGRIRTRAAHFNHRQHPGNHVIQTDFVSVLPSGEHIVESFAGVGVDVNGALMDACRSFGDCTFHALISAFLGRPCEQAAVETWEIGGSPRTIAFGSVGIRGEFPPESWESIFAGIEAEMKISGLPRGLHWVRFFYFHFPGGSPTVEVLLDNKPWVQLRTKAAGFPWPASEKIYSVRLFFVIQDK